MKNAILLHGTCDREEYFSDLHTSLSNSHWLPWLQKQLLIRDILTQTPEMPQAYDPQYDLWEKTFERFDVDKNTILVGHSCGAGFLLRWLSENKVEVNKLILVAPWIDPDRFTAVSFFDFQMDKTIGSRINTHLFISNDDQSDVQSSVEIIKSTIGGIRTHLFENKGHFTFGDMKTDAFPELLETILTE